MSTDWSAINRNIPEPIDVLPHRDPLLLLRKVTHVSETRVVGEMCLAENAPIFRGHFPGQPIVPGVYLIEAMAQTLAFHERIVFPDQNLLLASVKSAKFREKVVPGDVVVMDVEVIRSKLKFVEGIGVATIDGAVVAEVHCLGARVPLED